MTSSEGHNMLPLPERMGEPGIEIVGLDHVQFNMIDDETLRAAQKDPEKYQEVIVRVAGYSAHFVDISRKTQDNIIQRTIQGLG